MSLSKKSLRRRLLDKPGVLFYDGDGRSRVGRVRTDLFIVFDKKMDETGILLRMIGDESFLK